jgi:hypothetical protein
VKLDVPLPNPEDRLNPRTDPRYPGKTAGANRPTNKIDPVVIMIGSDFRSPRLLTIQTSIKGIARIG